VAGLPGTNMIPSLRSRSYLSTSARATAPMLKSSEVSGRMTTRMGSMEIPRIETERLTLRGMVADDFEAMAPFYASEVSRFYGGPCDREMAWRKFAMYPGHWVLRGYGPWMIELRTTGEVLGLCGPWYPDGWAEPEITWALVPGHHGKGYATEAARAALAYVFAELGWTTAVSVVALENIASIKVAERLGATAERELDYFYGPGRLYRHQPAEPTA
jgi:RimJ/RimL family protein N-acetyltransferase